MKSKKTKLALFGQNVLKTVKDAASSKTFILFAIVALVALSNASAATDTIDMLDDWGDKILSVFSSNWIKALACVALIVEAISMVVAGQQGGGGAIIKKFAPWIIGTIILLCASGITSYFLGSLNFDGYDSLLLPSPTEAIQFVA